jgi:hypothetical protein
MAVDASTLPFSPTLIVAGAAIAVVSAFVTGPEIAHREIARSSWGAVCEADLQADLEATRAPRQVIPSGTDCSSTLGMFFPELRELCYQLGNPDPAAAARAAERRAREAEETRIRRMAARSGSRCACAETVYIEEERVSLALYAASGRLITPSSVENRQAALSRALNAPACNFGQGD